MSAELAADRVRTQLVAAWAAEIGAPPGILRFLDERVPALIAAADRACPAVEPSGHRYRDRFDSLLDDVRVRAHLNEAVRLVRAQNEALDDTARYNACEADVQRVLGRLCTHRLRTFTEMAVRDLADAIRSDDVLAAETTVPPSDSHPREGL